MDPLLQYNMTMRGQRASGYPNASYMQPHPYEMAMQSFQQQRQYPFRYNQGQGMKRKIYAPLRQQNGQQGPQFTPFNGQQSTGMYQGNQRPPIQQNQQGGRYYNPVRNVDNRQQYQSQWDPSKLRLTY